MDENKKINTKINVMFQKIQEYSNENTDSRFIKVKIWLMHTKSNYNGSYFSKEVIQNAIPTLVNTPILCYIEENQDNESDFSDHRMVLERKNGEFKLEYKGSAIGVIPETNNAHFENRLCDDGIEREFLVVDGLVWTKWDNSTDIFNRDIIKSQSMELSDNYEGHFESDNLFHFDKFEFFGSCSLGKHVEPAMKNSTIEVQFSTTNVAKEIENKLNEFAKYFSKQKEVEQEDMAKNKKEVLEEKDQEFDKSEEVVSVKEEPEEFAKKDDNSDESDMKDNMDDDMENKMNNEKTEDSDEEKTDENFTVETTKNNYSIQFSLSYEETQGQIYQKLWDLGSIENTYYGLLETNDDYFIYVDYKNISYYKQSYSKEGEDVSFIGEREQLFNVFVDADTYKQIQNVAYSKLKEELELTNQKIIEYAKSNEELVKFKSNIEENSRKAEIDKVIARFSTIDELNLENYKKKAYNKELDKDSLEKELFALIGKQNFNKINNNKEEIEVSTNYTVSLKNTEKCPYDGLEDLFK